MNGPWTEGPRELLEHGAGHLEAGGDFDRRIAMISIDNGVELSIKTYLGLPNRIRYTNGPGRKELESASESFPQLLDLLDKYASNRIIGLELGDIEWYHRIRNQLYHSGNGITVEREKVEAYFQIASALFENLFESPLLISTTNTVQTKTGIFLQLWIAFEHQLRPKLPPKETLAYYWKQEFLERISKEAASSWSDLLAFRNVLVHSPQAPDQRELNRKISELRNLISLVENVPSN